MTTPHPNADLLRAIADGKQMQCYDATNSRDGRAWINAVAEFALYELSKGSSGLPIRIKPDTIIVNGVECNAPMRVEPEMGNWYYTPTPTNEAKFTLWAWLNDASGQRLFAEGLCFATAEDAAAAARAMIAPLKLNGGEAGAALSTAAQPLTQAEQENQLCISSASCGQASTNESAFITSTQRSAGTFSASSERQSYRDSDGMPTERAVLEREWRRMKIALSATAAQPPADGALNTIAAMFHSGEEIEGPYGLAMMVDMSVWNDALDAFEGIIGDEME